MSFRNALKSYITYKNLKMNEVAESAGIAPNTLSRYVNNKSDIGSDKLLKILTHLGIDIFTPLTVRNPDKIEIVYEKKQIARHILHIIDMLSETERKTFFKTLTQLGKARNRKLNSVRLKDSVEYISSKM